MVICCCCTCGQVVTALMPSVHHIIELQHRLTCQPFPLCYYIDSGAPAVHSEVTPRRPEGVWVPDWGVLWKNLIKLNTVFSENETKWKQTENKRRPKTEPCGGTPQNIRYTRFTGVVFWYGLKIQSLATLLAPPVQTPQKKSLCSSSDAPFGLLWVMIFISVAALWSADQLFVLTSNRTGGLNEVAGERLTTFYYSQSLRGVIMSS